MELLFHLCLCAPPAPPFCFSQAFEVIHLNIFFHSLGIATLQLLPHSLCTLFLKFLVDYLILYKGLFVFARNRGMLGFSNRVKEPQERNIIVVSQPCLFKTIMFQSQWWIWQSDSNSSYTMTTLLVMSLQEQVSVVLDYSYA